MNLFRLFLSLYPKDFRDRFEAEMIQTFNDAAEESARSHGGPSPVFLFQESTGILVGAARECLSYGTDVLVRSFEDRAHWLSALGIAAAIQAYAYGTLVPIGPGGIAGTGAGLYRLATACLILSAAIEVSRLLVVIGRDRRRTR
jgi:hypothetical protein